MAFLQKLRELPDTGTVSVATRLPRGIRLDLPIDPDHPELGERPFAVLRGWSVPANTFNPYVVHRVGVTTGVDAAKFKQWHTIATRNKFSLVMDGMIFAYAAENDVRARAKEEEARPQINARLDPDNPGVGLVPSTRSED